MRFKKYLALSFCSIFLTINVLSQQLYQGTSSILTIGKSIEYLVDTSEKLSISDIISDTSKFSRLNANVPNLGLVDYPVWLKIGITNATKVNTLTLEVAQAQLDQIEFYYPISSSVYKVNKAGENYPFNARPVKNHNFVYELNIAPGSTKYFYVKLKTSEKLEIPIYLGTKGQIISSDLSKNILFGIFFGIIIVMFFYNLFIYFTVKDPIYLYYVAYILIVGLIQGSIEGYTFQFLWPDNTFIASRAFYFFTALVNISGLEFVRRFLHTKTRLPKLDKLSFFLYVVYTVAIVLAGVGLFNASYKILQGFAGIVSIYMLSVAIIIARQGYRPAKFFVIAWVPLIAGIIVYVLKDVGVLPYSTLSNYSITIGSALEVILLSFALADKITILETEKRSSQEEALRVLQENERIIREQNLILESMVQERTVELQASNEELVKTLQDLKETETQLVESEKMASLGQLTAGIAHEINNPINFVTSNVSPLRRDVDILLEIVNEIQEIGLKDVPLAQKQKEIEDVKEEKDFDYLKVEIEHLLQGINEGASRTAEIVKGLRVFSRLDEDDLKKADINEGLDSTIVIINHLLTSSITIKKNYSGVPMIECFPGKLNQVFLNMMSNAIHAIQAKWGSEPGGELTLSTWNDEVNVFISIKDNGIGMDENTKKKLFEPFFTTKDVGEGTGLGLSIAYNTVRKHNGTIEVSSAEGEGTEFVITIPIHFVNQ